MLAAYGHLADARALLHRIVEDKESLLILRWTRDWSAQAIEASLRAACAEANSTARSTCWRTIWRGRSSC
jgi:hypothetical protein